jgi:hypothetical protein
MFPGGLPTCCQREIPISSVQKDVEQDGCAQRGKVGAALAKQLWPIEKS